MEKGPRIPTLKDEVVKSDIAPSPDLYTFAHRDDIVVRPLNWTHFLANGRFRPRKEGGEMDVEEFASITKRHFDELRSYGIHAPVSFVVADAERASGKLREDVIALVQKVSKNEHADMALLGKAFAELRENLLHYYENKFNTKESFLADLVNDRQYVYGKIGEGADALYLVDIDPYLYADTRALRKIIQDMVVGVEAEKKHFSSPEYDSVCQGFKELLSKIEAALETKNTA